jgi:NifU-like protein involved in Fe-S cluster formation
MWKYSEKLIEHFSNPRNVGSLQNPDGHGEVGSPVCGDAMTLDIRVDDDQRISEIKFKTFGCAGAIASASALTEMAKGKTLEEALSIKASEIAAYLGGMPKEKFHCSVLGNDALTDAIEDYKSKREELKGALEKILADPPEDLARLFEGDEVEIVSVHASRARLRGRVRDSDTLTKGLSEHLTESVGREVKVDLE